MSRLYCVSTYAYVISSSRDRFSKSKFRQSCTMINGTVLSVINSAKIYRYFTGNQAGDTSVNAHYSELYEVSPYVLLGPKITTRIIRVNDLRQRLPTYVLYVCGHGKNTRCFHASFCFELLGKYDLTDTHPTYVENPSHIPIIISIFE